MELYRAEKILEYFKSPQWQYFLDNVINADLKDVYHSHLYVRTSVHPDDLGLILEKYFDKLGCPLTRSIDKCAHYPPAAGLHGVMPKGKAFFDFFFIYDEGAILEENTQMPLHSDTLEREHNQLIWTSAAMRDFSLQYDFRPVGMREEQEIEEFFSSKHWKDCIRFILDEEVVHPHSYVELNFDPKILELFARKHLREIGWTVERSVPCTFDVHGQWRGKIALVLGYPEKMFDIGWKYVPDVTIRPSGEVWCLGTEGYDLWTRAMWDECIAAGDYRHLSEEELAYVLKMI